MMNISWSDWYKITTHLYKGLTWITIIAGDGRIVPTHLFISWTNMEFPNMLTLPVLLSQHWKHSLELCCIRKRIRELNLGDVTLMQAEGFPLWAECTELWRCGRCRVSNARFLSLWGNEFDYTMQQNQIIKPAGKDNLIRVMLKAQLWNNQHKILSPDWAHFTWSLLWKSVYMSDCNLTWQITPDLMLCCYEPRQDVTFIASLLAFSHIRHAGWSPVAKYEQEIPASAGS